MVTTNDLASNELITIIYRVDDLVRIKDSDGTTVDNYDPLIDLLETVVMPTLGMPWAAQALSAGSKALWSFRRPTKCKRRSKCTLTRLRFSRAAQLAVRGPNRTGPIPQPRPRRAGTLLSDRNSRRPLSLTSFR